MRSSSLATGLFLTLLLGMGCKDDQTRVAEAAARRIKSATLLGPGDVQMVSMDGTIGLEVIGDSVHVFMPNSVIRVPATRIQNVKFADNRLRFDVDGIGVRVFDVGDGTEGAVFNQADALQFVTAVVSRQAEMESR